MASQHPSVPEDPEQPSLLTVVLVTGLVVFLSVRGGLENGVGGWGIVAMIVAGLTAMWAIGFAPTVERTPGPSLLDRWRAALAEDPAPTRHAKEPTTKAATGKARSAAGKK